MFDWIRNLRKKSEPVKHIAVGTGEFRLIQNCNASNTNGYISLIIHNEEVVAQKFVTDGDLYNELFDYIVNKLGGRIWSMSEK